MPPTFRRAVGSVLEAESTLWPALAAGVIVAVLSLLVGPHRGDLDVDVALASMATFLFGVLIAFTIARTTERLAVIQNLISRGNASLLSIHQLVGVFSEEEAANVRRLVDRQLTNQIDYRLLDNHLSTPTHLALTDAVVSLNPETSQEEVAYKGLVETCIDMASNRALIEATTGQSLSPTEWIGLLLLLAILLSLIVVLPGGTVLGALVAGALAGTLVTLVILLRKLDLLRWHERSAIWEPTARLFHSIGELPYVPREIVTSGRYRPLGRVRLVDYPDPYPNRSTKIVTIEDLAEDGSARAEVQVEVDGDANGAGGGVAQRRRGSHA